MQVTLFDLGTITSSPYFLSLLSDYQTFESVIDVIRDECVHVEVPFFLN